MCRIAEYWIEFNIALVWVRAPVCEREGMFNTYQPTPNRHQPTPPRPSYGSSRCGGAADRAKRPWWSHRATIWRCQLSLQKVRPRGLDKTFKEPRPHVPNKGCDAHGGVIGDHTAPPHREEPCQETIKSLVGQCRIVRLCRVCQFFLMPVSEKSSWPCSTDAHELGARGWAYELDRLNPAPPCSP